uniref:SEC24 homolog B, COPII coat complex component n=1 Tax=Neogobius melanostomus TaxID=47308 RepID=A0A8C6SIL0_9GOBI
MWWQPFPNLSQLSAALGGLSGVPELEVETLRPVNLVQERNLLPPGPWSRTFRCTLTSIPQTQALLNKARLPLGLLLHPFRDLQQLPVITSNTIVRCRTCRTYINPFVTFLDQRRWKCNLCYRVNDVPDEFMYNPVTRSYGEPHRRPEVQNSTVEFIASSDYMLRPPQPAVYLFVLDVSHNAVESGYLKYFCDSLLENLDKLPGNGRCRVGFLTFDSTIHFYNLQNGLSQPQMLVVSDIHDVFIPSHDNLMVNLKESKELVKELLAALPSMFAHTRESQSALGPALQAAFKLMTPTGGRVSVFQTQLPTLGAGLLQSREDPNQRSSTKAVQHLGPATDFYKKLALDCSGQQIGVDLFLLSSQYSDLSSLACMSKFSAGSVFYYPSFHHVHNPAQLEKFQRDLERYLTRKIGFEAVMRIRCTKGLSIHTFHGNLFVRSTDMLSLANVNPDSAFAVQMSIEDSLADSSLACFQAALLYTSSKGKRRIRVHTLCLPVVTQLSEVYAGADVQAITCLLANMAIDRSVSSGLPDARDALVNAVVDLVGAYRTSVSNLQQNGLVLPSAMRLFPLYILALLKQKALRTGTSTRLDERVFAMCQFKTEPLPQLMRLMHPDLYRLDTISDQGALHLNDVIVPQPQLLHLSSERLSRDGTFLLDCGSVLFVWVGRACSDVFLRDVLGVHDYASLPPSMNHIPELDTPLSERIRAFLDWLQENRAFSCPLHVIRYFRLPTTHYVIRFLSSPYIKQTNKNIVSFNQSSVVHRL